MSYYNITLSQTPYFQVTKMAPVVFIEQSKDAGLTVAEENGRRMLTVVTDIGDFVKEEVQVRPVNDKLVIHARRDVKQDGDTGFREFNKEYRLPESVDPFTVEAVIREGQLIVRAPLTC